MKLASGIVNPTKYANKVIDREFKRINFLVQLNQGTAL